MEPVEKPPGPDPLPDRIKRTAKRVMELAAVKLLSVRHKDRETPSFKQHTDELDVDKER